MSADHVSGGHDGVGHDSVDARHALPKSVQVRYLILAGAGVAAIAALVMLGKTLFHHEDQPAAPLPPGVVQLSKSQMASVKLERVDAGDDYQRTDATGQIAADDTLSTPVFLPYSGQVTDVYVQAGAQVTPGQPLLKVRTGDVVDARNTLFAATAQHASANAQLKLAQANLARAEQVYKTAGGALKDYQQAQNDYAAAQANQRSAESALAAARDKLVVFGKTGAEIGKLQNAGDIGGLHAETVFHAPIAGVIAQRSVSSGQYVQSGGSSPVLTIANPARVWLVAQLAESDASAVHLGDGVDVTVPGLGNRVFHATIDNVAQQLDPTTHRLPVRATIANADRALKPQMFANFTIRHAVNTGNRPDGVTVPAQAVIHEGDAARVWISQGNGRLVSREVKVADSSGGRVRITDGLKAGEVVATTGAIFVNEAGLDN
ncbi:efflux RND transporter periplasmic adaptor subunit [Novosphingobium terrae]|uniref:efflux RND transporter periplasmic adaptor subunit n=1 Tax=Novosphingobium terrae TaxID=2726189 RepID=UPI00197D84B1|nr:efflux RND transporter periplasmic adaptor subunit [Novosphingobium terrae]